MKSTAENDPLEERVRQRAYELYLSGGGEQGSAVDDWFQAEEEIQLNSTDKKIE
jgi:hypothetical protein